MPDDSHTQIFEVWDKISETKDEVLGLIKVRMNNLSQIGCASLYPTVFADDYLPIQDIISGDTMGQIKILVAVGTPVQI